MTERPVSDRVDDKSRVNERRVLTASTHLCILSEFVVKQYAMYLLQNVTNTFGAGLVSPVEDQ